MKDHVVRGLGAPCIGEGQDLKGQRIIGVRDRALRGLGPEGPTLQMASICASLLGAIGASCDTPTGERKGEDIVKEKRGRCVEMRKEERKMSCSQTQHLGHQRSIKLSDALHVFPIRKLYWTLAPKRHCVRRQDDKIWRYENGQWIK